MAYLQDTIESLVKKGLKKAAKKCRKKCSPENSSSDSDSEQEIGCGDTGLHAGKRLKLDEPLGLNLMSTKLHPIKVTSTAAKTISGKEKVIKNAKQGT